MGGHTIAHLDALPMDEFVELSKDAVVELLSFSLRWSGRGRRCCGGWRRRRLAKRDSG